MKTAAAIILIASLAGCATPRLIPPFVKGDSASVTVSNTWGPGEALPYAAKHCATYGKVPQQTKRKAIAVVFDCVAP